MSIFVSRAVLSLATACALSPVAAQSPVPPSEACRAVQAAARQAPVSVPFALVDGRVYVEARVNGGGPYRFAVDTGASGMGRADARLVAALGLSPQGTVANSDGVRTTRSETVRLDALALGSLARRDVEVITRDYASRLTEAQRFDGILGRDFFADGLLVLDYPARRLLFTPAPGLAPEAAGSLGYERPFRVPTTIAGVETTAHLDTGANVTVLVPKALYDRIPGSPLQAAGPGQLTNGRIDTARGVLGGPLVLGDLQWPGLEVRVSDAFPEVLVGAHVLARQALAIDERTRRVALCPPGGG